MFTNRHPINTQLHFSRQHERRINTTPDVPTDRAVEPYTYSHPEVNLISFRSLGFDTFFDNTLLEK